MNSLEQYLTSPVQLDRLELHLIDLPQKATFKSGIGVRKSRIAIIVKWIDASGAYGYGECSCRPDPFYSEEFSDGSMKVIQDFIFPMIRNCTSYGEVLTQMDKIRGWNFTKSAVESAMNDMIRRSTGKGILEHWGREKLSKVPVGISMGIQDSEKALREKSEKALSISYHRLKFKVNPASDPAAYARLNEAYDIPHMSFDANGTFTQKDFSVLAGFENFEHAFEQAFSPKNNHLYSISRQQLPNLTHCLDESVKSMGDLVQMHQLQNIQELNIKPGRVGGWYQTIQLADYAKKQGIPCWIGGMFETGVGRSQNIQAAAYLPEAVAHDLSPSSRYFVEDILTRPVEMDNSGFIDVNEYADFEIDESILSRYRKEKIVLS